MMNKMNSITEAVKRAWEILFEDHEWIPQNSFKLSIMESCGDLYRNLRNCG